MQFAPITATAALSLVTACMCQASEYHCGLANEHVLEVKSWAAAAKLDGKVEISITVGMRDLKPFRVPSSEKVAKLAGFARFEFKGGATAVFSIGDPSAPIGIDDDYIYRQTIDATSNNTPLLEQPRENIQAFACLANRTLTSGQEWIAN